MMTALLRLLARMRSRWVLRRTRLEMADALAQIRAEEKARLLAKHQHALRLIAEGSGARRRS